MSNFGLLALLSSMTYYLCLSLILFIYLFILLNIRSVGDVELTNMQLKPEALNALKLPIKVKAGFLGSVRLKV